jgi:K+-transporting ATPase A subunit
MVSPKCCMNILQVQQTMEVALKVLATIILFGIFPQELYLILSRYLPIIGPVAIAGILANKKYIPESAGTLKTDTLTFGLMTFAVIVILAALAFFPALTLGPIAEYFNLNH